MTNPITMAIEGACVSGGKEVEDLRGGELLALERFRNGAAKEQDWQILSVMTAISALMGYEGIGIEALRLIAKSNATTERAKQNRVDIYFAKEKS